MIQYKHWVNAILVIIINTNDKRHKDYLDSGTLELEVKLTKDYCWWIRNLRDMNETCFLPLQTWCQYQTNPKAGIDPLSWHTDGGNNVKLITLLDMIIQNP